MPRQTRHTKPTLRRGTRFLVPLVLFLVSVGCQQEMARQPSYRKYEPSTFFPDGTSARPIPAGAVGREEPRAGDPVTTGLKPGTRPAPAGKDRPEPAEPGAPDDPAKFVDTFPFAMTQDDLERGRERFTIFCTACHGPLGDGGGKIPERGYLRPPNYHTDASRGFARFGKTVPLRDVPAGYVFEVITRGYGAMPRYAPQIKPADRWRIVAYFKALVLSQHAPVAGLPEGPRKAARDALGGTP